ncbi:hypothetical protein [Parvularcula oceani]|uniref:hypothetical protein n=1 Tax=Parvularcula oceani TaxID=1247963 RepID=UPI0004E1BD5A|nr:hypothetical protein [Parvularcula oceani]
MHAFPHTAAPALSATPAAGTERWLLSTLMTATVLLVTAALVSFGFLIDPRLGTLALIAAATITLLGFVSLHLAIGLGAALRSVPEERRANF